MKTIEQNSFMHELGQLLGTIWALTRDFIGGLFWLAVAVITALIRAIVVFVVVISRVV